MYIYYSYTTNKFISTYHSLTRPSKNHPSLQRCIPLHSDLSFTITISHIPSTFHQFLLAVHKDKRSVSSSLTPIYRYNNCESFGSTSIKRHGIEVLQCHPHEKRHTASPSVTPTSKDTYCESFCGAHIHRDVV